MIRLLSSFIVFILVLGSTVEARDPYYTTGYLPCLGGEIGYWQFVNHETADKKVSVALVLTTVDVADPAFVICWVDGKHRVMAIGKEKHA